MKFLAITLLLITLNSFGQDTKQFRFSQSDGETRILGKLPSDIRFELTHQQSDSTTGWQFNNQLVFHKLPSDWNSVSIESFIVSFNSHQLEFPNTEFNLENTDFQREFSISDFGIDISDNCQTLIEPRAFQEFEISWHVVDSLGSENSITEPHRPFSSRPKNEEVLDSTVFISFSCTFRIIVPQAGEVSIGPIDLTINNRHYVLQQLNMSIAPELPETNAGLWIRKTSLFGDEFLIIEQKAIASKRTLKQYRRQGRYSADLGIPYVELNLEQFNSSVISISRRSHGMGANLDKSRNRIGHFDEGAELMRSLEMRMDNEETEREDIGFKYTIYKFKKLTNQEIILEPRHFINLPTDYELDIKL